MVVAASAAAQITTDGLVGYWNMDPARPGFGQAPPLRLAPDTSRLYGAPIYSYDPALGPVLSFNGDWGFVVDGPSELFRPVNGTLEVWVCPDAQQEADLVTKVDSRRLSYGLSLLRNGAVRASIAQGDAQHQAYRFMIVRSGGGKVVERRWQQLVLRWDGYEVAIFRNGELLVDRRYDATDQGLMYGTINQEFYIGLQTVWGGKTTPAFRGMIGPVRLYERALTPEEIAVNFRFHSSAAQ